MTICYEFVLACQISENTSSQVVDTLKYMTMTSSSKGYRFDAPAINYPLFTEKGSEWRTVIANDPREGEQILPGLFGVHFENYNLSIRRLLRDDEFLNTWIYLGDWLASISSTSGLVGYYKNDTDYHPTLIYFEDGRVLQLKIEGQPISIEHI